MPSLFDKNQQLDESELVDYPANKAPRRHKTMLISQGFNLEIGYPVTLLTHCKRAKTTENNTGDKFSASVEDCDTKSNK